VLALAKFHKSIRHGNSFPQCAGLIYARPDPARPAVGQEVVF